MKRLVKVIIVSMLLFFSITLLPTNVSAAKKKITVNKVYTTTTKVKGKTKKNCTVKIKIGDKTYSAKANKKGKYTIKIPKQKAGKKLYVKVYKGKKYYGKKKFYVIVKKASFKKFSKTSKYIKGYTRPKYKVTVTMNGKTYTKKASSKKGYFSIKMKKAAGNATATINIYNTKGKLFKTYKKRAYNASNNVSSNNNSSSQTNGDVQNNIDVPTKDEAINKEQLDKDIKQANATGEIIDKGYVPENWNDDISEIYDYFIRPSDGKTCIGYTNYYLDINTNGETLTIEGKNGITLYYTVAGAGEMVLKDLQDPTFESDVINPGEIKTFKSGQYDTGDPGRTEYYWGLWLKIKGYKDGKLMFIDYSGHYML